MADTQLGANEVRDFHIQGPLTRSKVAVLSNALVGIRPAEWRVWDAMATLLPGTPAADDLGLATGVFGTGVPHVSTGDVKSLGTTTRRARTVVPLPPGYLDLNPLKIRSWVGMTTTVADTSAVIDFEIYRIDHEDGTPGALDLVTTAAQSMNSLSEINKDFTLDPNTLHPGDQLDIRMTITVVDAATVTAVIAEVWKVELVTDLQ